MANCCTWLILLTILAACTCGGRTECGSAAKISLLTSIHDDVLCKKVSPKGVLLYEAAKYFADVHNNKTNGSKIELTVVDTCGSIIGTLKSAMKALVSADVNCLQPPSYLGIIGPDSLASVDAVQKMTSVLKVPHIVRKSSGSPFVHQLVKADDDYIVQGVLKILEILKWKSFTLVANVDDEGEDDVQNIAKKLTIGAIAKNFCVAVYDSDEDEYTKYVIHIGKPEDDFFKGPTNATVIVVSEGNLEKHFNLVNSTNTVLLLEDARGDIDGLEDKVEKSKWWKGNEGEAMYDTEELNEVRWLKDAINVYTKTLDTICKKRKCRNQLNPIDWNGALAKAVEARNEQSLMETRTLSLSVKSKTAALEQLGSVVVQKGETKVLWKDRNGEQDVVERDDDDDDDDDEDDIPDVLEKLIAKKAKAPSDCTLGAKEAKMIHDTQEATRVIVSEMDDSEWWTMVGTVSGVGIAMFVIGILAVYVVYTNIRGPRPKGKNRGLERDTSLRRVGSEREAPSAASVRNQRPQRGIQRRDSNRSIRSNISEKSV